MKQAVEIPWSIGDVGWAILKRSTKKTSHCDTCNHTSDESVYTEEVRECQIDSISVTIRKDKPNDYWYQVGFDVGDTRYPEYGRFTYGTQVPNVFASREEAEASQTKAARKFLNALRGEQS